MVASAGPPRQVGDPVLLNHADTARNRAHHTSHSFKYGWANNFMTGNGPNGADFTK